MIFKVDVKQSSSNGIEKVETKTFYNADDESVDAKKWIREGIPSRGVQDCPQLSSGIKVKQTGNGKMLPGSFGYYYNVSNDVGSASQNTVLVTSGFSCNANGCSILPSNFNNIVSMFSARKLIAQSWINDKDQYLAPNEKHVNYSEFTYDSLVFSLFNTSSHQSSLREVVYKGKEYGIKNEFFFMSKQKMQSLADAHSNQKCFNDVRHSEDRFVSKLIKAIESGDNDAKFSDEAQLVLNLARELVINSFEHRPAFDKVKPEYQINNWDCGWYQVKGLLNWIVETGKDKDVADKYLEFKDAYKALGDKMRPMVYELGFLKK